jgi:tRNA pseudouridine13 synthase
MLRLAKGQMAQGTIKSKAEDFVVEEITSNGTVLEVGKTYSPDILGLGEDLEGRFLIFVMQKTNWNTAQALKTLARKFRRGIKSTGFAGTKDRTSVSTQLCSIFGLKPQELARVHIKDIKINGAWQGSDKVEMGGLLGNRFGITVREPSSYDAIPQIISELDGIFPNYYGEQRFGNRKTNVAIGTDILRGDFKGAAMRFLTDAQNETNEEAKTARERLQNELDFKEALKYFPEYLKYERYMLEYLARFPDNYANAIRKLPRSISLMFIHSVESQIFNQELEERIRQGKIKPEIGEMVCYQDAFGFPDLSKIEQFDGDNNRKSFIVGNILGYDTKTVTELEQHILDDLGLTPESFKVQGINELNSKGAYRALFAPFKDISHGFDEEQQTYKLGFSLPAGAYATVFMDELINANEPSS